MQIGWGTRDLQRDTSVSKAPTDEAAMAKIVRYSLLSEVVLLPNETTDRWWYQEEAKPSKALYVRGRRPLRWYCLSEESLRMEFGDEGSLYHGSLL